MLWKMPFASPLTSVRSVKNGLVREPSCHQHSHNLWFRHTENYKTLLPIEHELGSPHLVVLVGGPQIHPMSFFKLTYSLHFSEGHIFFCNKESYVELSLDRLLRSVIHYMKQSAHRRIRRWTAASLKEALHVNESPRTCGP